MDQGCVDQGCVDQGRVDQGRVDQGRVVSSISVIDAPGKLRTYEDAAPISVVVPGASDRSSAGTTLPLKVGSVS